MLKILSMIILSTAISSCSCFTPTTPHLTIPDRPNLPRISASEFECLNEPTFKKFVEREEILKGHIYRLEAIIRATQ